MAITTMLQLIGFEVLTKSPNYKSHYFFLRVYFIKCLVWESLYSLYGALT